MDEGKSSLSGSKSYSQLGEFWDSHDSSEYWDEVPDVEFDGDVESRAIYYPVEISLAMEMRATAKRMGLSPKVLLAKWVREKLDEVTCESSDVATSENSPEFGLMSCVWNFL